jgi:UDPglucose 6-dehydrogenase
MWPHSTGSRSSAAWISNSSRRSAKSTNPEGHFLQQGSLALWTLRGKRVAALGLAYKGDTDDIRDSPAIEVIRKLLDAGAIVSAYDPAAMGRAQAVLPPSEKLHYAADLYEAAKDADAVLILTDWKEFASIDLVRLHKAVRFPIVIDGRNLYKPQEMLEHGFTYVSVGRPANYQAQLGKPHSVVR